MKHPCRVLPVIHFLDHATSMKQSAIAAEAGADGVFLINHSPKQDDRLLTITARAVKVAFPNMAVGVNMLHLGVLPAVVHADAFRLDMVWGDACGVSSAGLTEAGRALSEFAKQHPKIEVFASVAFKYQPHEPFPSQAAQHARASGFIPTTSGVATGAPPDLDKIRSMSVEGMARLAVASGMTVANVAAYAPFLSAILVATGVSIDDHHFDAAKLQAFVATVKGVQR